MKASPFKDTVVKAPTLKYKGVTLTEDNYILYSEIRMEQVENIKLMNENRILKEELDGIYKDFAHKFMAQSKKSFIQKLFGC